MSPLHSTLRFKMGDGWWASTAALLIIIILYSRSLSCIYRPFPFWFGGKGALFDPVIHLVSSRSSSFWPSLTASRAFNLTNCPAWTRICQVAWSGISHTCFFKEHWCIPCSSRLKSSMPFKRDLALRNIIPLKTTLRNAIPNKKWRRHLKSSI